MKAVKNRLRRRQQNNGNPTISEEKTQDTRKVQLRLDLNHHQQSMDCFVKHILG